MAMQEFVHFQNRTLYNRKSLTVFIGKEVFLIFGPASWKFFASGSVNAIEKLLFQLMFVFDVGVGSRIGEVGFAALACEIAALGIFPFPSCTFLGLHFNVHKNIMPILSGQMQ